MKRTIQASSTAMALVLAVSTPALAQATWSYSDIDQDGNLELTSAEFEAFGQEVFMSWDANADQMIGENEFYGGVYGTWDADADGVLTESEYGQGWSSWFGDYDEVAYDDLDQNADAELTEDEFATGLAGSDIYSEWSGDGELGSDRFAEGLYDIYDADDDMAVTEAEYDEVQAASLSNGMSGEVLGAEVVSLAGWNYDDLYASGYSAEDFIDEMEVYGEDGEEIGDVEDIIIGSDGQILSIVAEVGGFWDIGDTHVSVPFDQVAMTEAEDGIIVPVTEETVGDYGFDQEAFLADTAESEAVAGVDDANAVRAWRASELIGDYARTQEGDTYGAYGYVNDLILQDGQVAAVVVQPNTAFGPGYRAYPYYGYGAGYGWGAGSPYYDMPYAAEETGEMEIFDYDRLQ